MRSPMHKKIEHLTAEMNSSDQDRVQWATKSVKNLVIGSNRQKNLVIECNVVPKLLSILSSDGFNIELKREAAVVLGSLAKGSRIHVGRLVAAGTVQQLLSSLSAADLKLVEASLRCLRNIFLTDMAPTDLVYQDQLVIPTLLHVIHLSMCTKECVSLILSKSCLTEMHQGILCHSGIIDAVAPLLKSGIVQVQLPALRCFSTLCYANRITSAAIMSALFNGTPVLDLIVSLMERDQDLEIQIGAAKCVAYLCRAGVIKANSSLVTQKAMPTLVRSCQEDSLLSKTAYRAEACGALAYLTEIDTGLQQLTAANNSCLPTLAHCLLLFTGLEDSQGGADTSRGAEQASRIELEQNAITAFASLCLTDEDIRRKVTIEQAPHLIECVTKYLNKEGVDCKFLLASARCVHALTRSVEQLRTTFQDRSIWKPLLQMSQIEHLEISAVSSAVLANLCLDFSPCREQVIEAGAVEILCSLARKDDEARRLNGIWGLMNLAYGGDEHLKLGILKSLGADDILRLLTESTPNSPLVLRLLGLIRNCLAQVRENRWDQHIDQLIQAHGNHIIQAVVFVLEGEYPIEAKELALTILSNISAGDTAKDFVITNEDILRKIANYMVASSPQLQVAATFCVCNLVWKEDSGFVERQLKLRELGIYKILQQLQHTANSTLFDRVKQALQQFG